MKPPGLRWGSAIGAFSPSWPAAALYPKRLKQAARAIAARGWRLVLPDAACADDGGWTSGSGEQRAAAFMALINDPNIDAIVCTIGGCNTIDILPHLDYAAIRRRPKPVIGHSDATALLMALLERVPLIGFHGPMLLPDWGEQPAPFAYTVDAFEAVLDVRYWRGGFEPIRLRAPEAWTNEFIDWGGTDADRPRALTRAGGWRAIASGVCQGWLAGGNVETLNALVGTGFLPNLEGALLVIEATGAEAYLPRLDRALEHLRLSGSLNGIVGLVVGRCPDSAPVRERDLASLVARVARRLNVPAAVDVDVGHTAPKLTLPFGVTAELNVRDEKVILNVLEPAVAEPAAACVRG